MRTIFNTIIIAFAALLFCSFSAGAAPAKGLKRASQTPVVLKGKVLDKTDSSPLGWATVALMTKDSTIVAGATCAEDGSFSLEAAAGEYKLSASLIGYMTETMGVTLSSSQSSSPIGILLSPDAQMLAGATVTERVKLVEMKIDKVVMNVSQSAFAQGSNALELIKKAPGVTIDKDGNVMLNGKSVAIWIDGRPSYLDGKSLEALLRSTNSESIDKFELMEHPSAKYDASGQGGIINIKTKRNMLSGLSGSMGLGGGGMYFNELESFPWQQSYWINLSYRTKKTNTFFSAYEGFYNTPYQLLNKLDVAPTAFQQIGKTTLLDFYRNYNVKLSHDWFINEKNTLGFIVYVPGDTDSFNSKSSSTEQFASNELLQTSNSVIRNESRSLQTNVNLNYTHVFNPALSNEITANLDYYHNTAKTDNSQVDTTFLASAPEAKALTYKNMNADKIYDVYSAKADWQAVVLGRFMMEAGGKWALSTTDNKSLEKQTLVPDLNSDFKYREHVGAAYVSLAGQLGAKVSFKAGLRGEYTNSFGDWTSSAQQTSRHYFDLFPTLFMGWQAGEKLNLNASYSRRIDRPGYTQLNPTKMYVDSKTYIVGNPDMLPQYSDNVNVGLMAGQHFAFNLGYNHASNTTSQLPSYEPDGTQYLTWGNYGKTDLVYASVSVASLPVFKWMQWTLNLNGLYTNTKSDATGFVRNNITGQVYTALSFTPGKDWKIDFDARYSSPIMFGNYYIYPSFSSNLAVKKNFLDDRLTLSVRLDDIFRTSNNDIEIVDETGNGITSFIGQKYFSQKLLFDITWSFGQSKATKQRKVGNLEEISRAGNKSLGQ